LRAFVDTATAEIKNSAFRPKVYARGPGGDDRAALVGDRGDGPRLTLDAARPIRLAVRARDGVAGIDLDEEARAAAVRRLPDAAARGAERDDRGVAHRRALPDPVPASPALDDLPSAAEPPAPRAAAPPFRGLFAQPFGPAALARYDAEREREPPPVFG